MSRAIYLVRHGQSAFNAGEDHESYMVPQTDGDHLIPLTDAGHEQARSRGKHIGSDFINDALVYRSPYRRTRETLAGVLAGAGVDPDAVRIHEDPRLRELEHGFEGGTDTVDAQDDLRELHSRFFYRYRGGESPADCYDRVSTFLESLMRQMDRKQKSKALIVSHGMTIRCFAMRFMYLDYETFETIDNPSNCDLIRICPRDAIKDPMFVNGRWALDGLRFRSPAKK
jgi:broad specificity phosphatase PhoE